MGNVAENTLLLDESSDVAYETPNQVSTSGKHAASSPLHALELSIVMPCLNEAETIGTCIKKAMNYLKESGISGEVVVADNGSTDGSIAISESLGARVVHVSQKGYGNALMAGIRNSRGKYCIMGDSDDSYDFSDLDPFVTRLREGYDMVVGNRFKGGIKPGAMPFLHQYFGNPALSLLGKMLFRIKINDFNCGIRGFRQDLVERLNLSCPGMEFVSEMIVKSSIYRLKTCEVPTVLSKDGRSRPPHLRTWQDGWRNLRFMLIFSPKWLFLFPGLLLFLLGTSCFLVLANGPVTIGNAVINANTMLYMMCASFIGFQLCVFWMFTRSYAAIMGLMPVSQSIGRWGKLFSLENFTRVGAILLLVGLWIGFRQFREWQQLSFGQLDYSVSLRQVGPSVYCIVLGIQMIFSGFFLGALQIFRK
jgi:glycosyltransferase involved in cell wall biosynthesis